MPSQCCFVTIAIGTRVKVRCDPDFGPGPWPAEPTATVIGLPQVVEGRAGELTTYWVEFDEPQTDADGDGPYSTSQVLAKYLELEDR